MRFSFFCSCALGLGLLAGCSDEGDDAWPPLGGGGANGMLGNAGRPNDGGSSGAAERSDASTTEDLSELAALQACDVPEPCGEADAFAQLIENSSHSIPKGLVSCVLSALAERRPGRYVHRTEAVFSNGSTEAQHVLVVAADGSVAYVRDPSQYISTATPATTVIAPDPSQRCTLKPASYFEACLADVQAASPFDDAAAWACVFGDGTSLVASRLDWFESCEREAPPLCTSGPAPIAPGDAGAVGGSNADATP